ncbi:MAG: hypothetical protein ABIR26_09620 [Ramlibacter sp.]
MILVKALGRTFVLFAVLAPAFLAHAATPVALAANAAGRTADAVQCLDTSSSGNCVNEMDRASDTFNPASAHNHRDGADVQSDAFNPATLDNHRNGMDVASDRYPGNAGAD